MRDVLRILRGLWRSLSHFVFFSLFTWTVAYLALLVINFLEFLGTFFFFFLSVLLYTPCVLGLRTFALFSIYNISFKKPNI